MLSLIAFVEETSGIEVRPEHVTLENFDTAGPDSAFRRKPALR